LKWSSGSGPFVLIIIIGFWLLFFSIFGVLIGIEWILFLLIALAFLLLITIFLLIRGVPQIYIIEDFEKKLQGKLYHFKCPNCDGIFAVKKTKQNNKKRFKMTCPDCGKISMVIPNPFIFEEEIPEEKSLNINFKCRSCGEGLMVWAEGSNLYPNVKVFSCPYCGRLKNLQRI
jgi:predicted RNA-binding Zn-ribbon protein involved in translation (DUF1610 family)